jgi:hypothetical protein
MQMASGFPLAESLVSFPFLPGGCMAVARTDIASLIEDLRREREELDGKVQKMDSRNHLSVAEELEVKKLKRLKLMKKDRIQQLSKMSGRAART